MCFPHLEKKMIEDLNAMPDGLSTKGQKAYKAIMDVMPLVNGEVDTGGCKTFYSPAEWRAKGEHYCLDAELIVVYDGGDVAGFFNYEYAMDFDNYSLINDMDQQLSNAGFYSEQGTNWYSGIYETPL
jgi:hypothetical protein